MNKFQNLELERFKGLLPSTIELIKQSLIKLHVYETGTPDHHKAIFTTVFQNLTCHLNETCHLNFLRYFSQY